MVEMMRGEQYRFEFIGGEPCLDFTNTVAGDRRVDPHEHLHGLVVLIQRRGSHLDDALVGTRLGGAYFEHFAFDPKFIAWPNRPWPAEFVEAGADNAASRFEIAFDEQPHRDRGRVPSARGETTKDRASGGSFVEMKRLWIEFCGKALDPVDIDADAPGPKRLSRFKIF